MQGSGEFSNDSGINQGNRAGYSDAGASKTILHSRQMYPGSRVNSDHISQLSPKRGLAKASILPLGLQNNSKSPGRSQVGRISPKKQAGYLKYNKYDLKSL